MMGLQGPWVAGMKSGPRVSHTAEACSSDPQSASVWTGTGRDLMMVVVVLHVLHFSGVCRGSGRRRVVSSAESHIQFSRGTRHISSGGHAHRARAV